MPDTIINTDSLLLQRVKEGDEKAFQLLFERYRNQLFVYLFKITKSKESAEEIVLDVFVKIWLGRDIVDKINFLEGFLFRIAYNKAIDFLRSNRDQPAKQEALWDSFYSSYSGASADYLLEQHHAEQAVNDAVGYLSPQQQKVFSLSREHGMTYEQIADKLKISRNTVRNHMAAALEFIRYYLQEKGYGLSVFSLILTSTS